MTHTDDTLHLAALIGAHVRTLRTAKGYSQRELGRAAGYADASSGVTISHIERGHTLPSLAKVFALAEALDTTAGRLLDDAING